MYESVSSTVTSQEQLFFSFLKNQYQDVHTIIGSTKAYVLDKERDKITLDGEKKIS